MGLRRAEHLRVRDAGAKTVSTSIATTLLALQKVLGLTERDFLEMPIGEVFARLNRMQPYHGRKWTRGELARIVEDDDGRAAVEVCQYLDERGPVVVAWDDNTDPEREREAERELEFAEYDASVEAERTGGG
jgi:hypothetical protein